MKLSYSTIWRTTDSSPAVKNIDNIFQFVQSRHFTKHMHAFKVHIYHDCMFKHDFTANLIWSHTRDTNLHVHSWHLARLQVQVWLHDEPEMKSHLRHEYMHAVMTLGMHVKYDFMIDLKNSKWIHTQSMKMQCDFTMLKCGRDEKEWAKGVDSGISTNHQISNAFTIKYSKSAVHASSVICQ